MATKIDQKIISVAVRQPEEEISTPSTTISPSDDYRYPQPAERPRAINGTTYKIRPPHLEESLYVVINDHVVDGRLRPFEIFIMSKNMESFQWMSIMTRMMSALMRQPHKEFPSFMIDEMLTTFDPNGGYFSKLEGRARKMPSVVAEIGHILKEHKTKLENLTSEELKTVTAMPEMAPQEAKETANNGPVGQMCGKCHELEVFMLDGCMTCRSCGDSKCG